MSNQSNYITLSHEIPAARHATGFTLLTSAAIWAALLTSPIEAGEIAGEFDWPLSPTSFHKEDHHLAWYGDDLNGYHAGEDWNRNLDSRNDRGEAINAIADGVVVYVQTSATAVAGKGKMVIIRHTLPGGEQYDSAYLHCDSIKVSKGQTVTQGQTVATIGSTGTTNPHLHWEIQADLSLSPATNPYYDGTSQTGKTREPLSPQNALRYVSPSLFVDDRSGGTSTVDLAWGSWTFFEVDEYAPSSNVYLEDRDTGERSSIAEAVDTDAIAYGIVFQGDDGSWRYYTDPMAITLEPGRRYAVYAYDAALTLNMLYPGFNHPDDRARQDVAAATAADSHYIKVKPDTLVRRADLDSASWEIREMATHMRSNDGRVWLVSILHATHVQNPLKRAVRIFDANTWRWKDWQFRSPNDLY